MYFLLNFRIINKILFLNTFKFFNDIYIYIYNLKMLVNNVDNLLLNFQIKFKLYLCFTYITKK